MRAWIGLCVLAILAAATPARAQTACACTIEGAEQVFTLAEAVHLGRPVLADAAAGLRCHRSGPLWTCTRQLPERTDIGSGSDEVCAALVALLEAEQCAAAAAPARDQAAEAAATAIGAAAVWALWQPQPGGRADPQDAALVALGHDVYAAQCARCHGSALEGQPDWRERLPTGRLPAPPHDATGHTWHHPDAALFGIIKDGLVPPYAPEGYASDMPAFGGLLTDEQIWAVLAFIKSHWPPDVLLRQQRANEQAR